MTKESSLPEKFLNRLMNYTILLMDRVYEVEILGDDYLSNGYSLS